MNNEKDFDQYIEELIKELNLTGLPDETHRELKKSLVDRMEKRVLVDLMEKMSKDQQDEVAKKIEEGKDNVEIMTYMSEALPDFTVVLKNSLESARLEIIEDMKRINENAKDD